MVLLSFRFGEELGEGFAVRYNHFIAHSRAEDVLRIELRRHGDDGLLETRRVVEMVFEHVEADIAQVLVGDVA